MAVPEAKFIWMDGKLVPWKDATVHVLTHALHYGSSIFEGIRSYRHKKGPTVLRLEAHVRRLFDSARIYRMEIPYSEPDVSAAILETVRTNELDECYIRPLVFRGYGNMGVNPLKNPVSTVIAVWPWGEYLGHEAIKDGADVCVSSWTRLAPNTLPTLAKTGANYMNSQLIKMEAVLGGFLEGIALDTKGYVSEGSGENLFLVCNGDLITPPLSNSVLPGITRDLVKTLAEEAGIEVREEQIPRERLYIADELFFTGTAAEITPIRSVDRIPVGKGRRGSITEKLQNAFYARVRGEVEDEHGWLTFVG
jgi:branched-chain amino acid aminotransferase